jgi:hypothetical protein
MEALDELKDVKALFESAFYGKNGDAMLRYLFTKCHTNLLNFSGGDPSGLVYEAGKYAMFCDILTMANISQVEFLKSLAKFNRKDGIQWKIQEHLQALR